MTLGTFLSHMGIGSKQPVDRYSHSHPDYSAAASHDPHLLYAYDAPAHTHIASSKYHHGHGGGHKSNAAMSALTLLSFLFFLHILQQCLKEHMAAMANNTPIVIMTGGREGEEIISKNSINKFDKYGEQTAEEKQNSDTESDEIKDEQNKLNYEDSEEFLTKVKIAEHTPNVNPEKYRRVMNTYGNRSWSFPGFVTSVDKK